MYHHTQLKFFLLPFYLFVLFYLRQAFSVEQSWLSWNSVDQAGLELWPWDLPASASWVLRLSTTTSWLLKFFFLFSLSSFFFFWDRVSPQPILSPKPACSAWCSLILSQSWCSRPGTPAPSCCDIHIQTLTWKATLSSIWPAANCWGIKGISLSLPLPKSFWYTIPNFFSQLHLLLRHHNPWLPNNLVSTSPTPL